MQNDSPRTTRRGLAFDRFVISATTVATGTACVFAWCAFLMAQAGVPFEWPPLRPLLGLVGGLFAFSMLGWPADRSGDNG